MKTSGRPTVSRRNLVRALLGRDIPPAGQAPGQPPVNPHAAGDAAYAAGDYAGAVAAYRASVHSDLSNAALRARLGHALYALGQYIQAKVEFDHVLRLTDGSDRLARLGLALTLLALDKPAKAAVVLAALVDPDHPDLQSLATATATALTSEAGQPDLAAARHALERLAQASGLLPALG
jgi:tetratricopeptide (TPR) repeat protein